MRKNNILVLRARIDLINSGNKEEYAPKIDFLSELSYAKIRTFTGPRYKIISGEMISKFIGTLILAERYVRRLFRIGEKTNFIEHIYWRFKLRSYSQVVAIEPPRALTKEANRKSIRIFEMQHGVITKNYIDGYDPDYRERKQFFVWSVRDAKSLESQGVRPSDVHVVGRYRYIRDGIMDEIQNLCGTKFTILVTLQWGLHSVNQYRGEVLSAVGLPERVITDLLQLRDHCDVVFKIHPVDFHSNAASMIGKTLDEMGFKLNNFSNHTLQNVTVDELLTISDLHITLYSTVVQDAASVGVPSLIIDKVCFDPQSERYDYFNEEIQENLAFEYSNERLTQFISLSKSSLERELVGANYSVLDKITKSLLND